MSQIGLRRLRSQWIAPPQGASPGEVVAHLGALQGQDYAGVKWSIGLRIPTSTDREVEGAFQDAQIVRTWAMRGTLHVVAAADVRWLLRLLQARIFGKNKGRYAQLGLNEATLVRANDVIARALEGGRHLTRGEIAEALRQAGIDPEGQRLAFMLQRAGVERVICFGVRRGNEFTYTLLDEWVPEIPAERDPEVALAELTRRYFLSRGPVTDQDFATWSGLSLTEARKGIDLVRGELHREEMEGRTFWGPGPIASPPGVHALAGFDEFFLGYQDRSAVIDPAHEAKVVPGGNGVFHPTIVVDGRIVGTWRRTLKRDTVEIEVSPFEPLLPSALEGFRTAAAGFAAFHERTLAPIPPA